jgi:DnaK suppressor protein
MKETVSKTAKKTGSVAASPRKTRVAMTATAPAGSARAKPASRPASKAVASKSAATPAKASKAVATKPGKAAVTKPAKPVAAKAKPVAAKPAKAVAAKPVKAAAKPAKALKAVPAKPIKVAAKPAKAVKAVAAKPVKVAAKPAKAVKAVAAKPVKVAAAAKAVKAVVAKAAASGSAKVAAKQPKAAAAVKSAPAKAATASSKTVASGKAAGVKAPASKTASAKAASTTPRDTSKNKASAAQPAARAGSERAVSTSARMAGAGDSTAELADKMKTPVVSKVSEVMTKTTKPNTAAQAEQRILTEDEIRAMSDEDYMNPAQLAFFKARLQALEKELLKNAGETTEHLRAAHARPRAQAAQEGPAIAGLDRIGRIRLVRGNRRADRRSAPDRPSHRHPVAGSATASRTEAKAVRRLICARADARKHVAKAACFFCLRRGSLGEILAYRINLARHAPGRQPPGARPA